MKLVTIFPSWSPPWLKGFLLAALWLVGGALAARAQTDGDDVHEAALAMDVMRPAYASAWNTETDPDVAAFNVWARRFAVDQTDVAEGVRLARQRRAVLVRWMQTDPARVLAAAVPPRVRARLADAVLNHLETPFSEVGDYLVTGQIAARGGPAVAPTVREIRLGEKVYPAHVYGRRLGLNSKLGIFLHGVLLDGQAVLGDKVLRRLSPEEAADGPRVARRVDVPGDAVAEDARAEPVYAEAGGVLYRFASGARLRRAEARLRRLESLRVSEDTDVPEKEAILQAVAPVPQVLKNTTGTKSLLVIRVDFSDLPGIPSGTGGTYTPAYLQNIMDSQVAPYYVRSSYGLTNLTTQVAAPVYRLPRTAASYATANDNNALHADAQALASADYNVAAYDRVCVVFSRLSSLSGSQITYGGLGSQPGRKVWVNGDFDFRILSHELGHTYGLAHADLWQVSDGNPASLYGTSMEYLDEFDTMGDNFTYNTQADFNAWYKALLGWVPPAQVQTITSSGYYRVSRSDGGTANGVVALRISRDPVRDYWISVRRNFTGNNSMSHGLYVGWGYSNESTHSTLLDLNTPGSNSLDAALVTGTTFTDTAAGISIKPVAEGGSGTDQFEDVQITLPPTNPPQITNSGDYEITLGEDFSFAIQATNSPTSYAASGLPDGLSFNSATGVISGTPTTPGVYRIIIDAGNPAGVGAGSFLLTVDDLVAVVPSLVLKADVPQADYASGQTGRFTVYLTEPTTVDLTVYYTLTGNAVAGRDYKRRSWALTIPAGTTYANVRIVPTGRHTANPTHNVLMTLADGDGYEVRTRRALRVTVTNP